MPGKRNFRNNQRDNKRKKKEDNEPRLEGSVNSRYLDRMREEGTPVGSNEWTRRRKVESEMRRIKAAQEEREVREETAKDRVPKAPQNW